MKKPHNKEEVLKLFFQYTDRMTRENTGSMADYSELQLSWNKDILERSIDYWPTDSNSAMGIGSFLGALEFAMSHSFSEVVCVDHQSYLPRWKPKNVSFHKANIDSNTWKMPEGEMLGVCYLIETLEHLLWSPLPLLTWMKNNSHLSVISTPDDAEWPPMKIQPWTRYQHFSSIPSAFPGATGNPEPMFHCKQYNQAEFVEMLNFVGFRVLEFFRTGEGKHQMVAIVQPR